MLVLLSIAASAQWQPDGLPVCTEAGWQVDPVITHDGSGGAIIAWVDEGVGIYAQRVDNAGYAMWGGGVLICPDVLGQRNPAIASDDSGGVYIAWADRRSMVSGYELYIQRINGDGIKQWDDDGIQLGDIAGRDGSFDYYIDIISDGSGYVYIAWHGDAEDIDARRVDRSGALLWLDTPNSSVDFIIKYPSITPDGTGGAFISYEIEYDFLMVDLYLRRVDNMGNPVWFPQSVEVCAEYGPQELSRVVSDDEGGVIVTWEDNRGGGYVIRAQRFDNLGNPQWGVPCGIALSSGVDHATIADGYGGAIVTWEETNGIYAQRIDGLGNVLWTAGGHPICEGGTEDDPSIAPDGRGGAVISWTDRRSGVDIYAQRVDFSGDVLWAINGNPVCTAVNSQDYTNIVFDGSDGAIIVWQDERDDPADIYAQYVAICASGSILYVDADATGAGDGGSWENAFTELRNAHCCGDATEIWVAEGTYKPTGLNDRTATFQLRNGLALYGGFAGTETNRNERDPILHPTILSGDIGVIDDTTDNSYHVVTGSGTDATAVLDGFTVTGGRADGSGDNNKGGGICIESGSPTISGVVFSRNSAYVYGGGMYNEYSSPTLFDVIFLQNSIIGTAGSGGGMHNRMSSSPTLTDVIFSENSAISGGGMSCVNSSNPTLTNVAFLQNSATGSGGGTICASSGPDQINVVYWGNSAVSNGGGMSIGGRGSLEFVNVSFSGNSSGERGGGMYITEGRDPWVNVSLTNAIFWGDAAVSGRNEIYRTSGVNLTVSYSLIEGCGGSGGGWDSYFGTDGGGNIDTDPQFKGSYYPDSPLAVWSSSPAINAGDNSAVSGGITTDIDGNPRIYDLVVDMGAYEHQGYQTGVDDDIPQAPAAFALYQNVPNPFNPTTRIRFDLPRAVHVKLSVYNIKGELVATIVNQHMTEGRKEITWTAKDNNGRAVASGIYFYRLVAGDFVQAKKMVLLR